MKKLKKAVLCLLVTAVFFLMAGCDSNTNKSLSMFLGDPQHSGLYNTQGVSELHGLKWKFKTEGRIFASPTLYNNVVYIGSDDKNFYAFESKTGKLKWKYATEGAIKSTAAVYNGNVLFMSYDGNFYNLDASDGKLNWKFKTEGEMPRHIDNSFEKGPVSLAKTFAWDMYLSSPVVYDDTICFGCGDGNVYSIDMNGKLKWKYKTGNVVHSSPAYWDNKIYIGSFDNKFYALNSKTGEKIWDFQTGSDDTNHIMEGIPNSPVIKDGIVYFGCHDSNLYALDATSGKQVWTANHGTSWVHNNPAVFNNKLYYSYFDGLVSVDAKTGLNNGFLNPGKSYELSTPAVAGNMIYVGVLDGTLIAVDTTSNGENTKWTFETEGHKADPVKMLNAEGKVKSDFTPSEEEIKKYEGNLELAYLNQYTQLGPVFSSPVIDDGTIYFGSTDGYLYAIY